MKIYDKEMYKINENLRNVIILIVVFLLGFFIGYITSNNIPQKDKDTNNQNIINLQ